jgi:parallel beta-helix repeat protein
MRRIASVLAVLALAAGCNEPTQQNREDAASLPSFDDDHGHGALVQVAAPTGDPTIDVPHIQDAVAAATPGAVIQFGKGKYALALETEITVSVPRITLQGHRKGTTILGHFDPDVPRVHFVLNGGRQTVRRLTFEGFRIALSFQEPTIPTGGYRVENSIFRNGHVPLRLTGSSDRVSTVEGNQFINVTIPFIIIGKTVHIRRNRTTSPNLDDHPFGRPSNAGLLLSGLAACENNVLEENTVVGNADGFVLFDCPNNVIRKNTFVDQIVLAEGPEGDNGSMLWAIGPGVQGNVIEENVLRGSEGQGIIIEAGSNNRIVGNRFSKLPGRKLSASGFPGAAIFLGEPTTGNRVRRNQFKKVKIPIVDCGTGNIIGRGQHAVGACPDVAVAAGRSAALDHPKLRFLRDRMKH